MTTVQAPPNSATNGEKSNRSAKRINILRRFFAGEGFVAVLIVVYIVAVSPFASGMISERNALNVLSNLWPLAIIVIGQTFVLVLGGIDLSQAALINITNTFGALLLTQALNSSTFVKTVFWGSLVDANGGPLGGAGGGGVILAVVIMVTLGALLGALNGLAVAKFGMPPFMVTLGTLLLFNAISVWMTRSENVSSLPPEYLQIGQGGLGGPFTYGMIIAAILAIAAHFVLSRTPFGRWTYASGTSKRTAIISGVPYKRVLVSAYTISAVFATIGGILYSTRLGGGRPTLGGDTLLLDVIGAAVIGGISLFGGKGSVLGAFLGAIFFVVLSNSLNLLNLPFTVVFIVKGLVIVAAALLDVARNRVLAGSP